MKRVAYADLTRNVLQLPRLPIPAVTATLERYQASVTPMRYGEALLSAHLDKMNDFLQSSAPVLQKQLADADKAAAESGLYPFSYVEQLMEQTLLRSRAPLEVNMNPGFVLKPTLAGTDGTQAGVAAALAHGIAQWVSQTVKTGLSVGSAGELFDVSPLARELGRSLIPSKETDSLHTTPLDQLRHIVVLHDGHPYMVRVMDEEGAVLDRALLHKAMEFILTITPDQDNTSAVSVLTAGGRAVWGQAYAELIKTPENAEALRCFHEAMLVVCLDSKGWGSDENLAEASVLHGSQEEVENRWYDKHQLIVSADGQTAFNFEPTVGDRVHWAKWIEDVLALVAQTPPPSLSAAQMDGAAVTKIVKHLNITYGKSFVSHIRSARQEALSLVDDTEVHSIHIPYGRTQLSSISISPDSFVQMCLQLAMYTLRGRLTPSSELCSTAAFFHGTTEVARTATEEMLVLATALGEAPVQGKDAAAAVADLTSSDRDALAAHIRTASIRHDALVAAATRGEGVDRHLLALRSVATLNGDKAGLAFFEDDVYKKSCSYGLSTCEFSRPWLQYYAFGPTSDNAYGLGYVVGEREVRLSLSAFTNSPATNVAELKAALAKVADVVYEVMKSVCVAK